MQMLKKRNFSNYQDYYDYYHLHYRSRHPEVLHKSLVLKIIKNLQKKHMCQSLNLIKKNPGTGL